MPGLLGFSAEKGLSQVLVSFSGREDLPEDYRKIGFVRVYIYRLLSKGWRKRQMNVQ